MATTNETPVCSKCGETQRVMWFAKRTGECSRPKIIALCGWCSTQWRNKRREPKRQPSA